MLGSKVPLTFGSMFLVTLLLFAEVQASIDHLVNGTHDRLRSRGKLTITDLSFTFPFLSRVSEFGRHADQKLRRAGG